MAWGRSTQESFQGLREALCATESHHSSWQGVTPLLLPRTSCAAGNGRFRNIHRTHPMSPCDYDLFAKVKDPLRGTRYNTIDELRAIGRAIRNINKDGRADSVRRLPNIWQKVINKGRWLYWRYINVVCLWQSHVQNIEFLPLVFIQSFQIKIKVMFAL